jgi:hypothetical protein
MLGARAPRHVYSALIVSKARRDLRATITYAMPHDITEVINVDIPAGGSVAVSQRTIQEGLSTLTGRIASIAVDGHGELHEPFAGVNSPVKNYKFQIGEDGEFEQ